MMKKNKIIFLLIALLLIMFLKVDNTYAQSCSSDGDFCRDGSTCCSGNCVLFRCAPSSTPTPTTALVELTCEDYGCTCRLSCYPTESEIGIGECGWSWWGENVCCCDPGEGPTVTPAFTPTQTPTPGVGVVDEHNATINFGIKENTNSNVWIQTTGGDIRIEGWGEGVGGYNYTVPDPLTTTCGGVSTYASAIGGGGSPGIIFTGDATYSFCQSSTCQERASINQWVVGGSTWPENFGSNSTGGNLKTSYAYAFSRLRETGMIPKTFSSFTDDLENGVYLIINEDGTDKDLDTPLSGYTFPSGKDYVFLVTGNLNVNGNIKIPVGSTATFVVKGDIVVMRDVGVTDCTSIISNIEGMYSTDGNFTMEGLNDCNVEADRRLNIAGNLIINAGLSGGAFQNQRTLCADNSTCPVLSIAERPDFILNAPEILKYTNYIWQEQAP